MQHHSKVWANQMDHRDMLYWVTSCNAHTPQATSAATNPSSTLHMTLCNMQCFIQATPCSNTKAQCSNLGLVERPIVSKGTCISLVGFVHLDNFFSLSQ